MRILRQIDGWILDRAQPIADAVHAMTGWDARIQTRILQGAIALAFFVALVEGPAKDWVIAFIVFVNLAGSLFGWPRQFSASDVRNAGRISMVDLIQRMFFGAFLGFQSILLLFMFTGETQRTFWCVFAMWIHLVWEALDVLPTRPVRHRKMVPVAIRQTH